MIRGGHFIVFHFLPLHYGSSSYAKKKIVSDFFLLCSVRILVRKQHLRRHYDRIKRSNQPKKAVQKNKAALKPVFKDPVIIGSNLAYEKQLTMKRLENPGSSKVNLENIATK